jgi:cytochrome c553
MKGVVANMTQDDMLAIAAYVGSLTPGVEESSTNATPVQTSAGVTAGSTRGATAE